MINAENIQYSIIEHLRTVPGITDVLWMMNGLALTNRVKPFFIVENMQETGARITAGRETFEEVYRFQVGVFAESQIELSRKGHEAKDRMRKAIQLYDTSQQPPSAAGFFYAEPGEIVPIRTEDSTDETNKHRSYIDLAVTIFVQGGTFEQ